MTRRAPAVLLGCAVLALALSACSSSGAPAASTPPAASSTSAAPAGTAHATVGDLSITGGYIPQPASPDVAAAYFTVTNSGSTADTIKKVTTSVTSSVMAMTESTSGGVGAMSDLGTVTVPAHGSVRFVPGHKHLMLEKPTKALKQGDRVTMTITFSKAGTVTLRLPVVPITGPDDASTFTTSPSAPMTGMSGMSG